MSYRPKIQALRLAGWRYSSKRSAWVHRAFNGRVGPVYVDPADDHPRIDEAIVIDHQGPRRGSEEPTADDHITLPPVVTYQPSAVLAALPPTPPAPPLTAATAERIVREELPRRPLDRHRPELASLPYAPRPLDLSAMSEQIHVQVQLSEFEEPRVVRVDGRPPRRGVDPRVLASDDPVVVPLNPARATG